MRRVWADSLYAAERQHLVLLLGWAAASLVIGTALGVALVGRGVRSGLLRHFAAQFVIWGLAEGAVAAFAWRGLRLRDAMRATQLEHSLWMHAGLEVGYVIAGATLALTGWFSARRLGPVGAGAAIIAQGIVLLLLDVRFLSRITA